MDEPTTGLDSQTAGIVVDILARLAQQGKTVVLSIHQPKFSIFKRFHSLILLHEGRVAYAGPASRGQAYFETLGFVREDSNNPADWFVELLTPTHPPISSTKRLLDKEEEGGEESTDESENGGDIELALKEEGESKEWVGGWVGGKPSSFPSSSSFSSSLTDAYLHSAEYHALSSELSLLSSSSSSSSSPPSTHLPTYATSLPHQIRVLSRRTLLSSLRNPASAFMQFGAMFFFVALIGGIYWKMDLGPQVNLPTHPPTHPPMTVCV